jgi:CheY-like chemotaxis protein
MSFRRRAKESSSTYDPRANPVLVVEDDGGLRAYLVTILEHQGYRVVAAGSGEEAFALLGDQKAMLAVLDIGLPGMDGFAVAEQLAPDVPVIVVTGDPLRAKVKALGRTGSPQMTILAKPIAAETFTRAVEAAL